MATFHFEIVHVTCVACCDEFAVFGNHEIIARAEENERRGVAGLSKFCCLKLHDVEPHFPSDGLSYEFHSKSADKQWDS